MHDKEQLTKICRELLKSNHFKNPIKTWARDLNAHFIKKNCGGNTIIEKIPYPKSAEDNYTNIAR